MLNHGIKDQQANKLFALFLVVHMAMWTLLPGLTRHELDSDSMMHFVWGQEWMLSYYLHPPFLPWVVAGFLKLTGISNWNYLLLSQINIAIAFIAIYLLARQFLRPAQALAAVCLLEFIPYYSFFSIRLNHSSLLISIWALTVLFAYYAISRRKMVYWIALGICLAIGMLTKYYAVTLVGAIGLYTVSTRSGRAQMGTLGPYASALVLALLLYFHVDYVYEHRIGTVQHIGDYFFLDSLQIRWKSISFFLAQLIYLTPAVVAFMLATYSSSPQIPEPAGACWTYICRNDFSATGHCDPWFDTWSGHVKSLGRPDTHYSRDHAHFAVSHQLDRYPVSADCDWLHCLRHTASAGHAGCHQSGGYRVTPQLSRKGTGSHRDTPVA